MATRVLIEGLPTHIGRDIIYELFSSAMCTASDPESAETDYDWEVMVMDDPIEGELGELHRRTFVLSCPDRDLAPCKLMDFDDRYTGKCKKLRKESRGW